MCFTYKNLEGTSDVARQSREHRLVPEDTALFALVSRVTTEALAQACLVIAKTTARAGVELGVGVVVNAGGTVSVDRPLAVRPDLGDADDGSVATVANTFSVLTGQDVGGTDLRLVLV